MKRPVRLSVDEKLAVTANSLKTGRSLWRAASGGWVSCLDDAGLWDVDAVAAVLEQARGDAQKDGVVGVYEVAVRDGAQPVTARERIRAHGPTVHPEFAVREKP